MRSIQNTVAALLFFASLIFSSAAMCTQPSWVSGDPGKYPSDQYLIGRGVGATEEEAQNRARGDLATIFEVRIEVVNANTITATQSGNKEQIDRLASQQVTASTDKVINGITIAEIWRDPVTQDVHALAVLPRAQASASLREELGKIDEEVEQQLQDSKAASDPLLKVGALNQALQASIKREGFQASLKVVDPSGRGIKAPVSQADVSLQLGKTLKSIRIAPEVIDDDGQREFAKILKGGLAAAGFLATKSENSDLVLEGKLSMNDLGRREGWYWYRASVEVSLVERDTHRVRGSQTWPVKASAQDAKTARSRALMQIDKLFKEELRTAIIGFADN